MSRLLSELLQAEEPLFGMAITRLEQASGNNSTDVRLTAEIVGKVHMKLRALGLDPHDTTGAELYHALYDLIARHDSFLAERIGCSKGQYGPEILLRIKQTVEALSLPTMAWSIKPSTAKRLLKATPPRRVMKQLGYRSVDSMIKRESISELFGAMRFIEDELWLRRFMGKYNQLHPADFESRKIEIIYYSPDKYGQVVSDFVIQKRHNISHLKEMGVIALLPLPVTTMPGVTIATLSQILHYINEIRLYSSFFKSRQVAADFGQTVATTLLTDPGNHVTIGDHAIHWRVIHRHFARDDTEHPELFQPHVDPEDLVWRKAEETLFRLEPALHFWYDMEYVGVMMDNRPISFNLMDMAISLVNQLPYGHHATQHMRDSLWNEIYLRYIGEQAAERQILRQLASQQMALPTLI